VKKFLNCLLALLIAIMLLGIMLTSCGEDVMEPEGEFAAQVASNRPLVPYATHYYTGTAEDHWAILIDLDDNSNYPHIRTNRIILKGMQIAGALDAGKEWKPHIGVATSVATTGVNIEWLHCRTLIFTDHFDYDLPIPEHGLNLEVVSDDLLYVLSGEVTTTVAITSETHLPSPLGLAEAVTVTVEAGDLLLYMWEVVDSATLDLYIDTFYTTE